MLNRSLLRSAALSWLCIAPLALLVLAGCGRRPVELRSLSRGDEEEETAPPTEPTPPAATDNSGPLAEVTPPAAAEPDDSSLSPEERQRHSAKKLHTIAAALQAYCARHGRFPDPIVYAPRAAGSSSPVPLYSWRVSVLPFLGYESLYRRFDLTKPYSSPENLPLLEEMPDVYRSPGYPGKLTSYHVLTGPSTLFPSASLPSRSPADIRDGGANTIILVEAGEEHLVAWSKPEVFSARSAAMNRAFAWKGTNSFVAVLASGQVARIFDTATSPDLEAAFSIAGGEAPQIRDHAELIIEQSLFDIPEPAVQTAAAGGDSDDPADGSGAGDVAATDPDSSAPEVTSAAGKPVQPTDGRLAIPGPQAQSKALELVKELFLERYKKATNNRQKEAIAQEMLDKSSRMGEDIAGKYVMLTTAQRIALECNDIQTAGGALQQLVDTFIVDDYEMKVALLRKTQSLSQASAFDTTVLDAAIALMYQAIERDDYQTADEMVQAAIAAARRINEKDMLTALGRQQRHIDKLHASYRDVQKSLARADQDPAVSELVGRYYALMKGNWSLGLPHLARGEHADFRRLAQWDLAAPVDGEKQLALGDGWYGEVAKVRAPEDDHLRRRALYWYHLAAESLPAGLAKIKAELRVKELCTHLGEAVPTSSSSSPAAGIEPPRDRAPAKPKRNAGFEGSG